MRILTYFSKNHWVDQERYLKIMVLMLSVALLSLIFVRNNIHEEWVYVNQAIQILYHHNLFDTSYYRPPLFAWLIIAVSKVIGVSHMVAAARIVCIVSFWAMAAVLFSLIKTVEKDTLLAWYAVIALYSFEMVGKHAWLAYADPLFAALTFAAVAWLWIGVVKKQPVYLYISVLALFLAIITKSFTCLFVYGVSWWVLFFVYSKQRSMLYSLKAIFAYLCFISALVTFFYYNMGWFHGMVADIASRETMQTFTLGKRLYFMFVKWPFIILDAMAPSLWVALFLLIANKKIKFLQCCRNTFFLGSLLIVLVNLLPYWLSKHIVELRYLYPLFPFIAAISAFIIFSSSESARILYCKIMMVVSVLFAVNLVWIPHWAYRYNVRSTAVSIVQIVQASPICVYGGDDSIFDSLRTQLQIKRYTNKQPNVFSCGENPQEYWVSGNKNQLKHAEIVKTFNVIGTVPHRIKRVYLLKRTE